MRILWVSTSPIGPASRVLGVAQSGSSGGWIQSEYEELISDLSFEHQMFFLCGSRNVKEGEVIKRQTSEGSAFCINLPKISFGIEPSKKILNNMREVLDEVKPDIIHIWGTESCISYGITKISNGIKKVVFIQGLIGMHYRYMGGYLLTTSENRKYYKNSKKTDRFGSYVKRKFYKRQIKNEQYIIKNCKNVIVDNDFSKAYCKTISKDTICHQRFLKPNTIFKNAKWNYDECVKNTIFTVFGQSVDKGLHQLLKALVIVKKSFPSIKVIIPGPFNASNGSLKEVKHLQGFEVWMKNFIKANGIEENVCFVGLQTPDQMANQIKNCNIYVNPSCMEVHALSLREAMTVGAPCISSLCGSVIEYLDHQKNGLLYRYEEYEVLAYYIEKILSDSVYASELSQSATKKMEDFVKSEPERLLSIYNKIALQK